MIKLKVPAGASDVVRGPVTGNEYKVGPDGTVEVDPRDVETCVKHLGYTEAHGK
jgi:hypothetical protein